MGYDFDLLCRAILEDGEVLGRLTGGGVRVGDFGRAMWAMAERKHWEGAKAFLDAVESDECLRGRIGELFLLFFPHEHPLETPFFDWRV